MRTFIGLVFLAGCSGGFGKLDGISTTDADGTGDTDTTVPETDTDTDVD